MLIVVEALDRRPTGRSKRIWRRLWELRGLANIDVVMPTVVSSPCPLLGDEQAETICSLTGMQMPVSSAWARCEVDLSKFLKRDGDLRLPSLERVLADCVDSGEKVHDTARWCSPALRHDSWLNRRLAIAIRGWGTIVKKRGADPRQFATLRELVELATFVTATLESRSRSLAKDRGHCPALDVAGTRLGNSSADMQACWRRAVEATALRHRNLTMMTPWDVFPAGEPAERNYVDLLPLLGCADCLSFRREVAIDHWNVSEYRGFYERIGAILESRNKKGLIAKHV